GSAKKASPGAMARLSALMPSTCRSGPLPSSKSDSANGTPKFPSESTSEKFGGDKFCIYHFVEIGADAKHWRHALHDPTSHLAGVPAGCGAALRVLALRLVDQDHHRILWIVQRERRCEDRQCLFGGIAAV